MKAEQFYPIYQRAGKITIDSRKVEKDDIFFAFSGEQFNAATEALKAVENGALAVIVEQQQYENREKNIFFVPSTLAFLQDLAKYHRDQLSIPIIALTGSNGKTTTKELIHAVLSQKFKVQYTFGNLNNHIGVPLTLLSVKPHHELAVIEMGANHQKEIEFLCTLAKPHFGYITNFGKAHLEGFGGIEGVIKGKSELYDYLTAHGGTLLVNTDDSLQVEKTSGYPKIISFGKEDADYTFSEFSENNFVGLTYHNTKVQSQLTGSYNFTNLCAAASLGLHFGISFDLIKNALESYVPTNMRSQIMEKNGKKLVLDTYNANPSSMKESLKNFSTFEGSKTVIMGDMLELGQESEEEHRNTLNLAKSLNFEGIITVGKHFKAVNISENAFLTAGELQNFLEDTPLTTKNILLKASRGIALEKIIDFI